MAPNAVLFFCGDVRVDDESARVEINLQDVGSVTDLISNMAKKLILHLTVDYPAENLRKLKILLDAAKGVTQVYLEVPSKAEPGKIHRIRTGKSILVHRSLLEFAENTLGNNAWSFE